MAGIALYVGKAKNLKARVPYARLTGHNNRILRMIDATRDMNSSAPKPKPRPALGKLIENGALYVLLRDDKLSHIFWPKTMMCRSFINIAARASDALISPFTAGAVNRPTPCSAPFCCAHV